MWQSKVAKAVETMTEYGRDEREHEARADSAEGILNETVSTSEHAKKPRTQSNQPL